MAAEAWEEDSFFGKWRNGMKIGIDIGGSHIGIGLIKEAEIVGIKEKNFNQEDRKNIEKTIVDSIQVMVDELLKENYLHIEDIELIGIAAPGTISKGIIIGAGNLGVKNFDIVSALQKVYTIPIQIRNDAKCAALAEKLYGSMKDYEDCVFLTIGTGIGGAAFLGGKLLEPKKYAGFEFGHMIVNKGGRLCSCGKQGCFETYSSIKALKSKVTETLNVDSDISGQYLREELLTKDDPKVKEDVEVFLEYLKIGIGNLIEIFEPEIVCLGGSFAYYEDNPIFEELLKKIHENGVRPSHLESLPKIVTAKLKNDVGMIGAVIESSQYHNAE